MGIRFRLAPVAYLALVLASAPLQAQRAVEISVRGSYLPLSSDEAAAGSTHGWGITPQVAFTLDPYRSVQLEVYYTVVPSSSDPANLTPRMQMAGGMLELTRGIEERFSPVAMVGVGLIAYSPGTGLAGCPNCLGGTVAPFSDAVHAVATGGLGVEAGLTPRLRLRADLKAHQPFGTGDRGGGTVARRTEYGLALRFRAR